MMVLALLLIVVFILGMIAGATVLTIIAFNVERREKKDGNKEESSV